MLLLIVKHWRPDQTSFDNTKILWCIIGNDCGPSMTPDDCSETQWCSLSMNAQSDCDMYTPLTLIAPQVVTGSDRSDISWRGLRFTAWSDPYASTVLILITEHTSDLSSARNLKALILRMRTPSCTGAVAAIVKGDTAVVAALVHGLVAGCVSMAFSSLQVLVLAFVAIVDVEGWSAGCQREKEDGGLHDGRDGFCW